MLYTNKTKTTVTELLSDNPKILKDLHTIRGFDFTKPFEVISGNGKFTLNSIRSQCKNSDIDTHKTTMLLIIQPTSDHWNCNSLYIVDVKNQGFKQIQRSSFGHCHCKIDYFTMVRSFEIVRKYHTKKWYVVIQKNDYISYRKQKSIDYTERMYPVGEYTIWKYFNGLHGGFSSGSFRQNNQIYYISNGYGNIKIDNPIDKSGYWLPDRQANQQRKLQKMKKYKASIAADNYDCTVETEKIKSEIDKIKKVLADMLLNDNYDLIDKTIHDYTRLCRNYQRHIIAVEEKTYSSIKSIEIEIEFMLNTIKGIYQTINKNI